MTHEHQLKHKEKDRDLGFFRRLWERIEDKYYDLIPYETRPGRLWYRFKCWAWHRHTTIKPRFLDHTWCDKTHILPHMVFEILCRFMEDEKPGEVIDWEWNEDHSKAWKELNELYRWWLDIYVPWEEKGQYRRYDEIEPWCFEPVPGLSCFEIKYSSPQAEERARQVYKEIDEEESKMNSDLIEKCQRVIALKDYLWT